MALDLRGCRNHPWSESVVDVAISTSAVVIVVVGWSLMEVNNARHRQRQSLLTPVVGGETLRLECCKEGKQCNLEFKSPCIVKIGRYQAVQRRGVRPTKMVRQSLPSKMK